MGRHSKNNNASSFFTSGERQMLKNYGSQTARVSRESMRDYDACFLCLTTAKDPKSCLHGHIACKECIYENILAQKKDISRQRKASEAQQIQRKDVKDNHEDLRKQEELLQFARAQDCVIPSSASIEKSKQEVAEKPEKKEGLTNFWLPSQTPEADSDTIKVKEQVLCPMGNDHALSLKKLISIKFSKDNKDTNICLACRKNLSNAIPIVALKECGHVVCKPCVQKFVKTAGKCFVCETKCKEKDLISLQSDGTGFAAKGNVEVTRYDLAFKA